MENNNLRGLMQMIVRRFGFLNERCCEDCCGDDISLVQSHILYEISRQSSPSMQDVANALGMDITTFSRQVKTLVERDLVKKTPHPNDNRVNLLSLTVKGTATEQNINNEMNKYLNSLFSNLSVFERDTIIRSLDLLEETMKKSESKCCPPR
ncbi:winged helix-turn-helix transcriptional regulator [Bacillus sp. DNRA2]|uniref:MarR family winged helix-turn-helix transcriptional regulator n=1 Tax=Bacillus sp. DNRA2 TaxID=2723053 RepID=UPI00145D4784|nr:MarR family winged helix-turn-helix transcriptional regulator [Bacillus sp. DNRA2]NMD72700.1 winged helix-turn-helix transcriptional regulator [Bacillus sp. DNRA2]